MGLLRPASVTYAEGARAAEEGRVVVYWRPGCEYCLMLTLRLGRRSRLAVWVNTWKDPEGAAYVRSVNTGNETVPTVVIGGEPHTNPPARVVVDALSP